MNQLETINLVTVTSDSFMPGTIVLFDSFQRHHPTWDGKFIVICENNDLSDANRQLLQELFKSVQFSPVSQALSSRIKTLFAARTDFAHRAATFYKLDAFGLGTGDVLYADSDILIRAPLDDLLAARTEAVLATGEGSYYDNKGRHPDTWEKVTREDDGLFGLINAGFMRLNRQIIQTQVFEELLEFMHPDHWKESLPNRGVDQRVINLWLKGQTKLLPASDNYLLPHHRRIKQKTGIAYNDARVWHFNARQKPWELTKLPQTSRHDPIDLITWQIWTDHYFQALSKLPFTSDTELEDLEQLLPRTTG